MRVAVNLDSLTIKCFMVAAMAQTIRVARKRPTLLYCLNRLKWNNNNKRLHVQLSRLHACAYATKILKLVLEAYTWVSVLKCHCLCFWHQLFTAGEQAALGTGGKLASSFSSRQRKAIAICVCCTSRLLVHWLSNFADCMQNFLH